MSAILYKKVDGKVLEEKVQAVDVSNLLSNGYSADPKSFADTNKSGKLSTKEVRQAAKDADISDWEKGKISDLKAKLGYEQD